MGGAEPAQPFVAADLAIAVVISLDELLAQPFGADCRGGKLLLATSVRSKARQLEALRRAPWHILGRDLPIVATA